MNDIVEVGGFDENRQPAVLKYEGVFYKGFGITSWLTAGREVVYCIHPKTKKIIGRFSGGNSINEVKRKIDLMDHCITSDMDYDFIQEVLEKRLARW